MATEYLTVADGRLAYDDQGTGPLVVCMPSMGDLRQEYRFLTPLLVESGYRVVTMDLRGLGESSVFWPDYSVAGVGADVLALIRHLHAGPARIVGTSMAAGAAVWAAVEAPELVTSLTLIGPVVHDAGPMWQGQLLYRPLFSGPWGRAAWMWYFATLYPTRKPDDWQEYLSRLRRNLGEPGRLRALRGMVLASKKASADRLARVHAPALVIMGTRDRDFKHPEEEARWLGDAVSARAHMIDQAGHYPHAEMPEKVAPLLLSFFQESKESVPYGG
jgi:pimeloyl-ACP methyl ester carboxylesterase